MEQSKNIDTTETYQPPQTYPAPSQHPYGAVASSPYGAPVLANYNALTAGSLGFYPPYSAAVAHSETAPSMGIYAPTHAHADQAAVSSPFYFSHLLPVKLTSDNYLSLASVGQPLQDEDFTIYMLNGLDDDYDNLIENIHGRDDPLPLCELYARLLDREQNIKARRVSPSFVSANVVTHGKPLKPSPPGGKPAPSS